MRYRLAISVGLVLLLAACSQGPAVERVDIAAIADRDDTTLRATVAVRDADREALHYSYQWTKNGVELPGATDPTLAPSTVAAADGDAIAVRVVAARGTAERSPATSATLTVRLIDSVTVTPAHPTSNEVVMASLITSAAHAAP